MKGHIRERSTGRWAIVLDVRDPATGKRKRRWQLQGQQRRPRSNEQTDRDDEQRHLR